jgi:hypothetical protein
MPILPSLHKLWFKARYCQLICIKGMGKKEAMRDQYLGNAVGFMAPVLCMVTIKRARKYFKVRITGGHLSTEPE